jgi:glucose-1-phosphate adenylyltransferase
VTYGGRYRIIDFPLSNCIHSGIDTVGVLTQYQPHLLHEYIGNGQSWNLDRMYGGVTLLPPFSSASGSNWYSGTANSVYQNLRFIESYDPEYVLILSGDHVYKMNYDLMLREHKQKNAECTIAVMDVPLKEASRYGILSADKSGTITEFEEKPKKPKSTLASMGIYIFNTRILCDYLKKDAHDPDSASDFGKNIIPNMLSDKRKMSAYRFTGYWKDVGTVESLWDANMDMLAFGAMGMPQWTILSRNVGNPPHFIAKKGRVTDSIINAGCEIYGSVIHSILSEGVIVEQGAEVRDSVIMANSRISKNASVHYSILGEGSVIEKNMTVGTSKEKGGTITLLRQGGALL